MTRNTPRVAYALVNLAALLWASNFALGRLLRDDIGSFTLTAARFTIAAVILTIVGLRLPLEERKLGRQWLPILGMGLTGVFGFGSLLYSGLRYTTATNGSLIHGTGPLIIGLVAALMLGERFTRRAVVGGVISLVGVAIVVSGGSLAALARQQYNVGDLLVLASVVDWGIYSALTRVVTRSRSALSATWLSTCLALPVLWVAAAWELPARPVTMSWPVLMAVLYIGVAPSVVAYLAWNEGVRRVGPAKATAFFNMLPFFGALIGVLWLGEPFSLAQLLGGGLIIAGSLITVWTDLRSK